MSADLHALRFLLLIFAGWVNRHQQQVIEYLVEENRVLKEQMGRRRVRLTDDQRRRLAAKANGLGRQTLEQIATLVTPDTLIRWYRRLIALKWTYEGEVERRGVLQEIRRLIVLMAKENAGWGYRRIQGALKNLGHRVARSTVAKVLQENGLKPAPERRSSWKTFLKAHWGQVAGMDFFTTEVWTPRGLVTYYVLFVLDLKSRRVHFAGVTPNPDECFMAQVARNLIDVVDGFLSGHRLLILDRDTKFTAQFKRILKEAGVRIVEIPYQAPNCNAHAERFVLSIKSECLGRLILFGERHLERAIREYAAHYHRERNHQGIENELIEAADLAGVGGVQCRERLGSLLKYYHRAA